MIPGIDPKIDYAFKRVFGLERNSDLLIDLIHAVLRPPPERRIVELDILDLQLPDAPRCTQVAVLTPESPEPHPLEFSHENGRLRFTIPEFLVYAVARIQLAE